MTTDIQSGGRHQRADTAALEQPMTQQQSPQDLFPDRGDQGRHACSVTQPEHFAGEGK